MIKKSPTRTEPIDNATYTQSDYERKAPGIAFYRTGQNALLTDMWIDLMVHCDHVRCRKDLNKYYWIRTKLVRQLWVPRPTQTAPFDYQTLKAEAIAEGLWYKRANGWAYCKAPPKPGPHPDLDFETSILTAFEMLFKVSDIHFTAAAETASCIWASKSFSMSIIEPTVGPCELVEVEVEVEVVVEVEVEVSVAAAAAAGLAALVVSSPAVLPFG